MTTKATARNAKRKLAEAQRRVAVCAPTEARMDGTKPYEYVCERDGCGRRGQGADVQQEPDGAGWRCNLHRGEARLPEPVVPPSPRK